MRDEWFSFEDIIMERNSVSCAPDTRHRSLLNVMRTINLNRHVKISKQTHWKRISRLK